MCEPTTIIMGVSAVVGAVAANKNAKDQSKNMAAQAAAKGKQQTAAAGAKSGERTKQARAERSRLRVAAGESGVAGQSFEAQLMDSAFQEDSDLAMIENNLGNAGDANNAQTATAFSNVNNPSLLESGLQIAGAVNTGHNAHTAALQIKEG